jgi:hypothetical protein
MDGVRWKAGKARKGDCGATRSRSGWEEGEMARELIEEQRGREEGWTVRCVASK